MARKTIRTKSQLFELIDGLYDKAKTPAQKQYLSTVEDEIRRNVAQSRTYAKQTGANYLEYLGQYAERASTLKTRYGAEMVLEPSTIAQFEARYVSRVNSKRSKGKKPGNITRDIVSDEAYENTAEQAKIFVQYQKRQKELYGEYGDYGVTLQKARLGQYPQEFWDAISEDRQRLKKVYYEFYKSQPGNETLSNKQIWALANAKVTEEIGVEWFYVKDK